MILMTKKEKKERPSEQKTNREQREGREEKRNGRREHPNTQIIKNVEFSIFRYSVF